MKLNSSSPPALPLRQLLHRQSALSHDTVNAVQQFTSINIPTTPWWRHNTTFPARCQLEWDLRGSWNVRGPPKRRNQVHAAWQPRRSTPTSSQPWQRQISFKVSWLETDYDDRQNGIVPLPTCLSPHGQISPAHINLARTTRSFLCPAVNSPLLPSNPPSCSFLH